MRRKPVITLLWSAFVVAGLAHAQGLYVETIHPDNDKDVTRLYFMPKMLKTVDSDGRSTIVRTDKEMVYTVDSEKKSYTVMTFAEMKAMMAQAKSSLSDLLEKRLESLPPDQRKKMEERMAAMKSQMTSPDVTYQISATGENKSISGYACEKYIVKRNGKEFETVWATKQIGGFESIKKDMDDMADRASSMFGAKRNVMQWFKDQDGFPVQTDSSGSVNLAKKIERKTFSTSEFAVPSGYTKEKNRMEEGLSSGKD